MSIFMPLDDRVENPDTVQHVDFMVSNHGSICLLFPKSDEACEWVAAHLPDDVQMHGAGIAVEPRYLHDIVAGIEDEGLTVV